MIVLDTHAWVWWLTKPEKLGKQAARVLAKAPRIGVPGICVWEVAMKAEANKLRFDRPYDAWLEEALALDARVQLLPLAAEVAILAVKLPWDHGDPADRMIVATARAYNSPLVTADERIRDSKLVKCVWE